MSIDRTTSSAFILRVTSAEAATVTAWEPNSRMKLVGTVALASTVIFWLASSAVIVGPLTLAPR